MAISGQVGSQEPLLQGGDKSCEVVRWTDGGKQSPGIARLVSRVLRRIDNVRFKRVLGVLGSESSIERPYYISDAKAIHLGNRVKVWHHARLEALGPGQTAPKIKIGDRTVVQPYSHIGAVRCVRIGANVLIASNVYITDHDHDWTNPTDPARDNSRVIVSPVVVNDYAWIGEKVIILKGVTIGERAIVGAGSVVTKDVPPDCIAVGCPAHVVKKYNYEQQAWITVQKS